MHKGVVWCAVLLGSTVVHLMITWRVGFEIAPTVDLADTNQEIGLALTEVNIESDVSYEAEDVLQFDEELQLETAETLLAFNTIEVPPIKPVPLTLSAQAKGASGLDYSNPTAPITLQPDTGVGGIKFGRGNASGDGNEAFAPYMEDLRRFGLDVVFCIDTTGSMAWVIEDVKQRIEDLVRITRALVPIARFGFVAYRDQDGPEYTTLVQPLTYSTHKLRRFLITLEAMGGGDRFEAVDAGIVAAINAPGWRLDARKLILVIGDSPLAADDLERLLKNVRAFRAQGGTVSTLDVSDQANPQLVEARLNRPVPRHLYRSTPMREFIAIGQAGQGDTATLDGQRAMLRRVVQLIIGDKFTSELHILLDGF